MEVEKRFEIKKNNISYRLECKYAVPFLSNNKYWNTKFKYKITYLV